MVELIDNEIKCETCEGTGQYLKRNFYKRSGVMKSYYMECHDCEGKGKITPLIIIHAIPGVTECPAMGRIHGDGDIVEDGCVSVCRYCNGVYPGGGRGNAPTKRGGGRVMPPILIGRGRTRRTI